MPASLLTVTPLTASGISHVFYNLPQGGLAVWYDATQISGVSSGASLSVWTDLSGSGFHLDTGGASAASQPTYATNGQNGQAIVKFRTTIKQTLSNQTININQPDTFFFASRASVAAQWGIGINQKVGTPNVVTSTVSLQAQGSAALFVNSDVSNAFVTGCVIWSGSSSTVYLNGTSTFTFGNLGATNFVGLAFGSLNTNSGFCNIDMGEFFAYNRILSLSEIQQAFSYLGSKWGVTIT